MKIRGQLEELPPALFWWNLAVRRFYVSGYNPHDYRYREAVHMFNLHAGERLVPPGAVADGL